MRFYIKNYSASELDIILLYIVVDILYVCVCIYIKGKFKGEKKKTNGNRTEDLFCAIERQSSWFVISENSLGVLMAGLLFDYFKKNMTPFLSFSD